MVAAHPWGTPLPRPRLHAGHLQGNPPFGRRGTELRLPVDARARRIDLCPAMTAAAPEVLRNHIELHRNRLGETLIAQIGRGDQNETAASAAFDLRIEPMTNQIGDCVDTLHSHVHA